MIALFSYDVGRWFCLPVYNIRG